MLATILVNWNNNNQPDNPQNLDKIIDWWRQKNDRKPDITSINDSVRQLPNPALYSITEIKIHSNTITYKEGIMEIKIEGLTSIYLDQNKENLKIYTKERTIEFQY
jgi:hypothetical protein